MQPQFAVSIHDIDAGGLAKSFDLPQAWIDRALGDTDVSATGPGKADVRLSKTGHDVIVRGKVTAPLVMACARCLKDVPVPVDTEISLLLRPAKGEHAPHTHGAHGHAHAPHAPHAPADKDAAAGKARDASARAKDKDVASPARPKDSSRTNGAPRKRGAHEEDEYEFSSEEADTDHYDGETVVLDDFLREALLLEAPSFPLCSEDCPGIRPTAKAASERGEPALDPRLSPLRALKTKLMLAATSKDAASREGGPPEGTPGPAPERPAPGTKPARPKIQAHRTQGPTGTKGAQAKARAKQTPKKRAK